MRGALQAGALSFDRDATCVLSCLRHVIGELHPEKVIHVRAERLFDAQGHFLSQRGLAVQKIGERRAAYFKNPGPPSTR